MPWFLTEYEPFPVKPYPSPGLKDPSWADSSAGKYCNEIWAKNLEHAHQIARLRRIGEVIVGQGARKLSGRFSRYPSEMLKRRMTPKQKLEFLHAVTFMCFMLQRSTNAPVHGILGDEGILHQAVHCVLLGWPRQQPMREALRYFERLIPGF